MSKICMCFPGFVAAGVLACLAGCSSEGSDPKPNDAELASLESELATAQGSLGGALDEAKACFEEFRGCQAAATASADCVEALKACLPAPSPIVAPALSDAGAPGKPGFFGFGSRALPTPGGGPGGSGFMGLPRPGAAPAGSAFNGLPKPSAGRGGAGRGGAGFRGVAAGVDPAALEACKESVSAAASGASDFAVLGTAFKACVADAFTDLFAGICERITTECAAAAAADVCDRLADACSDPALIP